MIITVYAVGAAIVIALFAIARAIDRLRVVIDRPQIEISRSDVNLGFDLSRGLDQE